MPIRYDWLDPGFKETLLMIPFLASALGMALALSPTIEPPLGAQIDGVFADLRAGAPGCAVAVAQNGTVVFERGYGTADLEHGVPISPQTVFDTGSIAKMFTAATIFLLEEQRKLSLEDSIRKYIPELPPAYDRVTLLHLLHHTGGVRDYLMLFELAGQPEGHPFTAAEVVNMLARQKSLDFLPGERHSYTNSGYVLLALVVEKASGRPLFRFADENLFRPLGLTGTRFFADPSQVVPNRADSYFPRPEGDFGVFRAPVGLVGDSGLLSTVGDLARWDSAVARPSSDAMGKALARLAEPGRLADGTPLGYGSGLFLRDYRGLKTIGHGGSTLGYVSDLLRFPEAGLTLVCLCNSPAGAASRRSRQVADLLLADRLQEEPATAAVSPGEAGGLMGLYWDRTGDSFRRVFLRERKLFLVRYGTERELRPVGGGRFRVTGTPGTVEIVFAPAALSETGDPGGLLRFERIEPPVLAPEKLAEYAGSFHSSEVGAELSIFVREGALALRFGATELSLEPFAPDSFRHEILGTVRFERGASGAIRGLTLNTPRAKGLRYELAARSTRRHYLEQQLGS